MNLKLLSVILGFIFAALTDAADSNTTTCTDNLQCSSCLCVSANNSMTFATGDTTTLCAHFVTVNNTSGCIVAERAAYPVVVDTFSSIQLTGGQTYFQNYGFVEIVIQVYGTVMSVPLTYLQLTEFYSSAFSIIIELNNGVVQSAYWDHECATCSSSDCYQFTMSNGTVIDNICNSPSCISTNDSSCDPIIYVAWIGTDSNGKQLTSAGMRLSRFDQFSLSDIISANTISPYVIPTPTNTTNTTTNTTSPGNTTGAGNTTDPSGNKTDTNTTSPGNTTGAGNTTDPSGNKTDTNTTSPGNTTNTTDTSGNKTDTNTTTSTNTTNTTDTSGNKTDTNTTTSTNTTNTTDTSGNKTDTNTTTSTNTTNTTDPSGNKTDTNTTTSTNTTDTKNSTEASTSTSSSDGSTTGTESSASTGTDTSTKDGTSATTGTGTSSGDASSSTTDTESSTSTGTDTSTKDSPTTVTKL